MVDLYLKYSMRSASLKEKCNTVSSRLSLENKLTVDRLQGGNSVVAYLQNCIICALPINMDDLNEDANAGELCGDVGDEGGEEDDDVDIYQDLQEEITIKDSDANSNVIERFNKLFSPRKRMRADFSAENALDEDIDIYDDLNTFENQLVAEEVYSDHSYKWLIIVSQSNFLLASRKSGRPGTKVLKPGHAE